MKKSTVYLNRTKDFFPQFLCLGSSALAVDLVPEAEHQPLIAQQKFLYEHLTALTKNGAKDQLCFYEHAAKKAFSLSRIGNACYAAKTRSLFASPPLLACFSSQAWSRKRYEGRKRRKQSQRLENEKEICARAFQTFGIIMPFIPVWHAFL